MPEPIVAYWEALPVWDTFGLKVLAALLLLGIAVWGWVRWPKRVATRLALDDPKARADVEDNFRKTVGQVLGGAVVLLGAALAYFQFSGAQQTSHDLLISNQVSKGFEQLGSDKVVVRLGGIYALEGVMNTSTQYHQPVLEALSAFVREGAKLPTTPPTPTTPPLTIEKPPTDIQAALTVIGRRSAGSGDVNLVGANVAGTDLTEARLDDADLSHANLTGANLIGARLMGADLSGADLIGADLTRAYLNGADLAGARLAGAHLTGTQLTGVNLTGADLAGADLTGTQLTGVNLTGADLAGEDLTDVDLTGADLTDAHLARTNLINGHLARARLSGADLSGADLTRAYLNGADLTGARLTDADLDGANLINANLTGANLTNANLINADLDGARVEGQQQLDEACGSNVVLPTGLALKPCPPKSPP